MWLIGVLWFVGLLWVVRLGYRLALEVWKRTIRSPADLTRFGAASGAWAVVTGSSDGIGKEYALDLARRGFKIFLISRTLSKLQAVAREIAEDGNTETRILAVDFAEEEHESIFKRIEEIIDAQCHPIGILVNNVAMNYDVPVEYLNGVKHRTDALLNVNIRVLDTLTRMILPQMVSRGSGGIINISSAGGMIPVPMMAVYSSTKAYVRFISQCLAVEYRTAGIAVQCITPGIVVSQMSAAWQKLKFGVTTPDRIVIGSLNTLGLEDHWCPYWVHALQEYLMNCLPRSLILPVLLRTQQSIGTKLAKK